MRLGLADASCGSWTERATLAAVLAFFLAVCLHGIADYWAWGHNGFMGAWFDQAARNTLRFGTLGQAVYHTGIAPPPAHGIPTPLTLTFDPATSTLEHNLTEVIAIPPEHCTSLD